MHFFPSYGGFHPQVKIYDSLAFMSSIFQFKNRKDDTALILWDFIHLAGGVIKNKTNRLLNSDLTIEISTLLHLCKQSNWVLVGFALRLLVCPGIFQVIGN